MKKVVSVKLVPARDQTAALSATLKACNEASNYVSQVAFRRRIWNNYDLRAVTYGTVRERFGLGAQAAQHAIKKVADAYKSGDRKWRYGKRERKFRPMGGFPFDARNMKVLAADQVVSIWTVNGRVKVPYVCAGWQQAYLSEFPTGESDLRYRNGQFFLDVTVTIPDVEAYQPESWIGHDMGIVNIDTSSTGIVYSGTHLNHVRNRNLRLRSKLQKKGTKSAKRLLKKRSGREARFATDLNHCISKKIVAEAKGTRSGIALEDLEGIRDRARLRKPQRAALHSWAFRQLGDFIAYKAKASGVPVVFVDPAYTSQQCSRCGHTDRRNRPNQATFACTNPDCGFVEHADLNAAHNIAQRGSECWEVSHAPIRGFDLAA